MNNCKYHPLVAATFYCSHCKSYCCDACINDSSATHDPECFYCKRPLENLGYGGSVEPFWRRLGESMRYPLKKDATIAVLAFGVIASLIVIFPVFGIVSLILFFLVNGMFYKYCFAALESTASGDMEAPSISEAYGGGASLLLKLLGIFIIYILLIGGIARFSMSLAGLVAVLAVISIPAVLIRFAQNENILDAINPLNSIQLISVIGMPYGLLLALGMVMMGSVGIISGMLSPLYAPLAICAQTVVSNFYMLVFFHLMGYMLFQYQDKLGFSARLSDDALGERSDRERLLARISVLVKEGEYSQVIEAFDEGLKAYPDDINLAKNYFNFLFFSKNQQKLPKFATQYLQMLRAKNQYDVLDQEFKKTRVLCPNFIPASPDLRFLLAQQAKAKGDKKLAITLLKGLHKQYPHFIRLAEAYALLADCLDEMPDLKSQAVKCRQMVEHLKQASK